MPLSRKILFLPASGKDDAGHKCDLLPGVSCFDGMQNMREECCDVRGVRGSAGYGKTCVMLCGRRLAAASSD